MEQHYLGAQFPDRICADVSADPRSVATFSRLERFRDRSDFYVAIHGSTVCVTVYLDAKRISVGLRGTTPTSRRWLNDMLIGYSRLVLLNDDMPVHVLHRDVSTVQAADRIFDAASTVYDIRATEESGRFDPGSAASLYWSSGVLNFGDWCGPHIVQRLSGRLPVQGNRPGLSSRVLYSVGSILGWIKRHNVDVWGSGLMRPFEKDEIAERKALRGIRVHAVRGTLTQNCVSDQIGWSVPDVFGDPALLLPGLYSPTVESTNMIAFVPHGIHRAHLSRQERAEVCVVDVRRDFRDVVDEIASCRAVVSTSLHGIVIAQAYGIPWVWLQVRDRPLMGGRFKFDDFFTNLSGSEPAETSVTSDSLSALDVQSVAQSVALPSTTVDLSALASALPLTPLTAPLGRSMSPSLD